MKYKMPAHEIELNESYDVIVAGGGPAGCAAAIAAAREGAKTLLIEASGTLGGMATMGLVPAWAPYTDGEKIIYGGISKEIFLENKSQIASVPEDKYDWVEIDAERLKAACDRRVLQSGADMLFNTLVCSAETVGRRVDKIIVSNKGGISAYRARVYIDCTGDADLYAFAGGEYNFGDDETHEVQPASLCFAVSGIDEAEYKRAPSLYGGNPDSPIHKILNDPEFNIPDTHLCCGLVGPGTLGFNAGHLWNVDGTSPKSVTNAMADGRKMAAEYLAALKKHVPSVFKNAYLVKTASSVGIRESRRIIGDYCFTADDFLSRRSFEDEIARNCYFIDVHKSAKENIEWPEHSDNRYEHYKKGESHGVPYRILCPRDFDNLLAAGRCVSTDRIAQGSLRIMPCCFCMGEAAGTAAALSLEASSVDVHSVDIKRLRKKLTDNGAYLPEPAGGVF